MADRRVVPWLLCLPLMLGGTELAHWLAFRLVYPDAWTRNQVLAQSGHAYLAWLPTAGGVALALLLSGLLLHARRARRGGVGLPVDVTMRHVAALPPLAFVLQEHIEALVAHGTIAGVALEPTFLPGLALQLPFALLAYVVARALLGAAARLGRALGVVEAFHRRSADRFVSWFTLTLDPPCLPVLATGSAERGPPR